MRNFFLMLLFVNLFGLDIQKIYLNSYNYEKMGDYKDAIKVLVPLYQKYPNGYTINLRLGWLFYLNKKYLNSIKHYQKASMLSPYSIETKLGLMKNYLGLEDYKKALNEGNIILKSDYYNFYGNYYEAVALKNMKDYKSTLSIANKMLSLYPTSILFLNLLGEVYYLEGKKELAKKIFKNVLILDPNNLLAKSYLKK